MKCWENTILYMLCIHILYDVHLTCVQGKLWRESYPFVYLACCTIKFIMNYTCMFYLLSLLFIVVLQTDTTQNFWRGKLKRLLYLHILKTNVIQSFLIPPRIIMLNQFAGDKCCNSYGVTLVFVLLFFFFLCHFDLSLATAAVSYYSYFPSSGPDITLCWLLANVHFLWWALCQSKWALTPPLVCIKHLGTSCCVSKWIIISKCKQTYNSKFYLFISIQGRAGSKMLLK